jgi:serine phosphatase RsbU (regulator of sigma subunit)
VGGVSVFEGAGTLRDSYEAVDWSAGPLGAPELWPPALRSALLVVLNTRFPAVIFWSPELVTLYNEAYLPLIVDKHPAGLGVPAVAVFPEIWDTIGPMLADVAGGAGANWVEDQRLLMDRRGFPEECFFTFSYSPLPGDDVAIGGVLDIAVETTRQVVDQRRLELLARLGDLLSDLDGVEELPDRALSLLRSADRDLPAVDILVPGTPHASGLDPRLPGTPPGRLVDKQILLEDTDHGRVAWLQLPGATPAAGRPVLAVLLSEHLAPDDQYLNFLGLIADGLGNALSIAGAHELERRAAATDRAMSETFQRSLLTAPPEPDHLQLAVRYVPAVADAQVGGDWYDAFVTSTGATCLVVGDVAGHDQRAAASMGQVRTILRGIAFTIAEPPAAVLSTLDRALEGLAVGALATAVLGVVEQSPADRAAGRRLLRWSNAGHPPPLVVPAHGPPALLRTPADLLLGLDPSTDRSDHTYVLEPGTTVLLFTDGLVERRGASIDDGLEWLETAAAELAHEPLEAFCDALLDRVRGYAEDDIALLALRAHTEDEPRPSEAGPQVLPAELAAQTDPDAGATSAAQ